MSESQVKKYKRTIRRDKDKILKSFIKDLKNESFLARLKFALRILAAK